MAPEKVKQGTCWNLSFLLCCNPRNGSAEMAAVYYERIDVEGHHFGPSSVQRKNALKALDKVLNSMTKLIKVSDVTKD